MACERRARILVVGHARHGKDTVCEILRDEYGFSFISSSEFACSKVVFPILSAKYGYATEKECFDDRVNHRTEWFNLIRDFNKEDATRLGRAIWETCDVYCGLRSAEEFTALKKLGAFDIALWVDAGSRVPEKENTSSMTVESHMADHVVDNSGSLQDLHVRVAELFKNTSQYRLTFN